MAITIKDLDEVEERFKEVFATKEDLISYKSDLIDKLDEILKEIVASREEETLLSHRVSGHEDRIENVEKKLDIQAAV
jgi:predicted nuclease with TOPRIM domain